MEAQSGMSTLVSEFKHNVVTLTILSGVDILIISCDCFNSFFFSNCQHKLQKNEEQMTSALEKYIEQMKIDM